MIRYPERLLQLVYAWTISNDFEAAAGHNLEIYGPGFCQLLHQIKLRGIHMHLHLGLRMPIVHLRRRGQYLSHHGLAS